MALDSTFKTSVGLTAAVVVSAAAYQASAVFAPLTLALFIIAIVWPLQSWLTGRMPALIALAITMTVTVAACLAFASLVVWGFSRVGRSLVAGSGRYQARYDNAIAWLEGHGVSAAGIWAEHFNVAWVVRRAGQLTGRVNTTLSFWLIALVYVILGLMEVEDLRRRVKTFAGHDAARVLLEACPATAAKIRKYMEVRTLMSLATGALVGAFAWAAGLQFAF